MGGASDWAFSVLCDTIGNDLKGRIAMFHRYHSPKENNSRTLVLLHGTGGDENDLLDVAAVGRDPPVGDAPGERQRGGDPLYP